MNKEIKSSIWLFIIVAVSIIVMVASVIGVKYMEDNSHLWIYFLIYFLIVIGLKLLTSKVKNKFVIGIVKFISFPYELLLALFIITIPTVSVFFHAIFYLTLSVAVPLIMIRLNDSFKFISISTENKIFFVLTLSIIISVTCYKWLLLLIYHMPPFRTKSSEKIKKFKLEELTEYMINKQNIRFTIYLMFFIYLCIYSFKMLENSSFLDSSLYDRAVLQSFLCFLAFDRVILNSKNVALLPSIILNKVVVALKITDANDTESK